MNAREAFLIAIAAHQGQDDKGGVPYIFHPLSVADKVKGLGEDFEVVALLHDVLEDTRYPLHESDWSPRQREAIFAITQRRDEPYFDYIRRCREDFIARVVKVADLRHNLSPERNGVLPEKEAASLRARYEKSLEILDGTDAAASPGS